MEQTLSIDYYKQYFKDAADLEKEKYVLEGAINQAKNKIQLIRKDRENTIAKRNNFIEQSSSLEDRYGTENENLDTKIRHLKKRKAKFSKIKKFALIGVIVFAILAVILFIASRGKNEGITFALFALSIYVTAGGVALLIVSNTITKRANAALEPIEKRNLAKEKDSEGNQLTNSVASCENRIEQLNNAESALIKTQANLSNTYAAVVKAMNMLYSKNLVASDYYNYVAMAHFYHYLKTQRCLVVVGPNGVIDTFVKDCQHYEALRMLRSIRDIAASTLGVMSEIKEEAVQTNHRLQQMSNTLDKIATINTSIGISNAMIASNTAQIAANTHRTTEYLGNIYARY